MMVNIILDVVAAPSFMDRNGRAVWVVLAIVALAGLVALFVRNRRRKAKQDRRGPMARSQ